MGQSRAGIPVEPPHLLCFSGIHSHRLFAEQVLPLLRTGEHGFVVQGIRRSHNHEIHLGVLNHFPPVRRGQLRTILLCRLGQEIFPPGTNRHNVRLVTLPDLSAVGSSDESGRTQHAHLKERIRHG